MGKRKQKKSKKTVKCSQCGYKGYAFGDCESVCPSCWSEDSISEAEVPISEMDITYDTAETLFADCLDNPQFRHNAPIMADETQVYMYLKNMKKVEFRDRVDMKGEWYLVAQRSFLGSCSSAWSSGNLRFPAVQAMPPDDFGLGGQCDPIAEIGREDLQKGINKCYERASGSNPSAGEFIVGVVELPNTYVNGVDINSKSIKRLAEFHKTMESSHFNQCAYEVISTNDNSATILVDPQIDKYWKYLIDHIKEHGYNACFDYDDIYYVNKETVVSSAINRCWYVMKNIKPGTILVNISKFSEHELSFISDRVELANPKSIKTIAGYDVVQI